MSKTNMEDCKSSVFDSLFGEWKCKKKNRRIYKPEECEKCEEYKKENGSKS